MTETFQFINEHQQHQQSQSIPSLSQVEMIGETVAPSFQFQPNPAPLQDMSGGQPFQKTKRGRKKRQLGQELLKPELPEDRVAGNISPFIAKLYEIVNQPQKPDLVHWSTEHDGKAFVITDPVDFATIILPRFFKHGNYSSFVRQLNIYGFRKIDSKSGAAFTNEYFIKNAPQLLPHLQRKKSKSASKKSLKPMGFCPLLPMTVDGSHGEGESSTETSCQGLAYSGNTAKDTATLTFIVSEIERLMEQNTTSQNIISQNTITLQNLYEEERRLFACVNLITKHLASTDSYPQQQFQTYSTPTSNISQTSSSGVGEEQWTDQMEPQILNWRFTE